MEAARRSRRHLVDPARRRGDQPLRGQARRLAPEDTTGEVMTRKRRRKTEYPLIAYVVALIIVPVSKILARCEFRGLDRLPDGPYILVANHVTKLDPLLMIRFVWEARRMPHFMAKASLFKLPIVGWVLSDSGQIPVDRHGHGGASVESAAKWLAKGQTVQIYPEGTLTRDPDLWPMKGKSGAVRLAQEANVPIVPVGQWGAQEILPPYGKGLHIFPRKHFTVQIGEPIPAERFANLRTGAEFAEATADVMAAITAEVETLRGPKPIEPAGDVK
ncbi:1-acyl-sn-glycerol-3-phosphate acyltransferase [Pseudoclavibacter sp. CFCC 13611]|nr:1-acyl-sn-glycerol-3-phosphate acyltransferase [Pseudoclavibacter sp. CFCC 13611]